MYEVGSARMDPAGPGIEQPFFAMEYVRGGVARRLRAPTRPGSAPTPRADGADLRCGRPRAQARRHSPRPQARQHPGARRRPAEDPRLRDRTRHRLGCGDDDDADGGRPSHRDGALHEPRAGRAATPPQIDARAATSTRIGSYRSSSSCAGLPALWTCAASSVHEAVRASSATTSRRSLERPEHGVPARRRRDDRARRRWRRTRPAVTSRQRSSRRTCAGTSRTSRLWRGRRRGCTRCGSSCDGTAAWWWARWQPSWCWWRA